MIFGLTQNLPCAMALLAGGKHIAPTEPEVRPVAAARLTDGLLYKTKKYTPSPRANLH